MPSTYTDSLRFEEQGIGENNNTWGDKLNATIDLIDKSIAGHVSVATTGGTTQLTTVNNAEDQARYRIIEITGTLGSNAVIEVPAVSKEYIVWDSTTRAGFTISFRIGAAGSTVLVPATTTRAFGISTDGTDWRPLSADLASETSPGIVEIATTAEAQAGSSNSVVLTPVRLQDVTATATRKGVVELATDTEAQTGTDTERAITAANLQAVTATETRKGVIELATTTEVSTGTDTTRAVTPAGLAARTATETRAGIVELATNAEAQTGTDTVRAVTPANLQSVTATETRKGIIELATQAEVDTGTDTTRSVVPATLKSYTDTRLSTTSNLGSAATLAFDQFSSVALGNEFTGGDISGYKIGDVVFINFIGPFTHNSDSVITSNSVVPAAFRPSATQSFGVNSSSSFLAKFTISTTGIVTLFYYDYAGGAFSTSGTSFSSSVSFIS